MKPHRRATLAPKQLPLSSPSCQSSHPVCQSLHPPRTVTIQDYLAEAERLERDLDSRLAQIDPATRIDAVKGQLREWRAQLDQLQKSITTVPPDGRRDAGIALNRVRKGFEDAMAQREAAGGARGAHQEIDLT